MSMSENKLQYLLKHDDAQGSLSRKEDGVDHHDHANWNAVLQSCQTHDPAATEERERQMETRAC